MIWLAFWHILQTGVENFAPFKQDWSLGFLCTTATLPLQCGVQPFAKFAEYRIYNHWYWFVLWWWTQEVKMCKFLAFIDHMTMFTQWRNFLLVSTDVGKHFKYWFSSYLSWNCWTSFLKNCWVILKQDKIFNFFFYGSSFSFTARVSASGKFYWMLRYLLPKVIFAFYFKSSIFLLWFLFLRSTSGERNHNLEQAEKISILWLIQINAILDFSERVWVRV